MARYTGPTTKIARKFGEPIFGADKYFEKKNYPPGQHGLSRKKVSVLYEYEFAPFPQDAKRVQVKPTIRAIINSFKLCCFLFFNITRSF